MRKQGHEIDKDYDLHGYPPQYYAVNGCAVLFFVVLVLIAIAGIAATGG